MTQFCVSDLTIYQVELLKNQNMIFQKLVEKHY